MPETCSLRGRVVDTGGRPVPGVTVVACDRDLPSARTDEQELGRAETDREGGFSIEYDGGRFRRGDGSGPDLVVRVAGRHGQGWAVQGLVVDDRRHDPLEPVFNVPTQCWVEILAEPVDEGLSEYEQVIAAITPAVVDVPIAELSSADWHFLEKDTGTDAEWIAFAAAAAALGALAGLPPEPFYAFGRRPLPGVFSRFPRVEDAENRRQLLASVLAELLSTDEVELRTALSEMAERAIVPAWVGDRAIELVRRLKQHGQAEEEVTFRLIDARTGLPLAGSGAELMAPVPASGTADTSGVVVFRYRTPADNVREREFSLAITTSDGIRLTATAPVPAEPGDAPIEVGFSVPHAETALDRDDLGLPSELVSQLAALDIRSLSDVRRAGGAQKLDGLQDADDAVLWRLGALADLDRLSPDLGVTTALLDGGFASVLEVARSSPEEFTRRLAVAHPEFEQTGLSKLHRAAITQVNFLDGLLTGLGSGAANGYPLSSSIATPLAATGTTKPPGTDRCGCSDCRAAVGPAARLADLLDYALRTLRTDNAPVTLGFLVERLHQPLADLPAECGAVTKTVRQARICIEVLRSVLGGRPLADPAREAALAAAERVYCFAAYTLLLNGIGTSYDEIRRASVADSEHRRALADRLGVALTVPRPDHLTGPGDELDRLLFDPDAAPGTPGALTEAALERIFGLPDTRRDPLSDGPTLRDDAGQLVRWSLDGAAWGVSTDADGVIHAELRELTSDAYQLVLYRDAERLQLVGHGDAPSPDGALRLTSDRGSGLAGTAQLAYTADDRTLEIGVLPAVSAWRLRRLRELWAAADHPLDAYRAGWAQAPLETLPAGIVFPTSLVDRIRHTAGIMSFNGPMRPEELATLRGLSTNPAYRSAVSALYRGSQRPPVIDPDVIGPEDFRQPQPSDPAFAIWIQRRKAVDQWLAQLRASREAQGLGPLIDAETDTTEAEFAGLVNQVIAPTSAVDLEAAQASVADLGMTTDAFRRLAAIRAVDANTGADDQPIPDDVWREAESILAQARKARRFAQWRAEERSAAVSLGGEQFWRALREPTRGVWPPPDGRPLLDPDLVRVTDLQHLFGTAGAAIHKSRTTQLAQFRTQLGDRRSGAGFDSMLRLALGHPDPGDPLQHDPVALLNDLDSEGTVAEAARRRITDDLHLTEADFRRVMAARAQAGTTGVPQPTAAEWETIYDALVRAHKTKHDYPAWLNEEQNQSLLYWQVLRAPLPAWRAPAEARQAWQQALLARCGRPLVDPDIIGPTDLRTVDPQDLAFKLWQQRRNAVDGWRAALKTIREAAPDTRTGWAQVIASPHGLAVDASLVTELGKAADRGEAIQDRLDQLGLSRAGFELLRRIGAHAASGQKITTAEWTTCYAVLAEARKRRAFSAWREEEREQELLLAPEYFRNTDASRPPDGTPLALEWWIAHRNWRGELDSRMQQQQSVIEGIGRTVDSAETNLLPQLRDALLTAHDLYGRPPDERADHFAQRYFIDARTDGCAVTTRIAQASETLETLLWSAHSGLLRQELPRDIAALAVAAWGEELLHLIARSTDGRLWHRVFDSQWHPWNPLDGPPVPLSPDTGLSMASSAPGRLELLLRGDDLNVWRRSYDGSWRAWELIDGAVTGTPAILSTGPDTMQLFALRNSDAMLQRRARGDAWSAWEQLGAEGTTSPTAVAQPGGRIDLVVGAPPPEFRRPMHRWFDGSWHEKLLDGPLETDRDPVLATPTAGRLDLFKTEGGHLMSKVFEESWQSWADLDAAPAAIAPQLVSDPSVVVPTPGRMELFAVGGREGLLQRSFTTGTGWGEWRHVPSSELELDAPDFDQEWPWIGTYDGWRSAKFLYYNVEDYLHPMLLSCKTPAFRRLIQQTLTETGLTPKRACELAEEYAAYFGDICTLQVQATCQLSTRIRLSGGCGPLSETNRSLFYQFAVAESGQLYWTATDSERRPSESDLIWHPIPVSEETPGNTPAPWTARILGAIPYGDFPERSIALFFQVQERGGTRRLLVSRFDASLFDLPAFERDPQALDDCWSRIPAEIKDLPDALANLTVVPVTNDIPPTLPAIVVHTVGKHDVHLRTMDPASGAWEGKAGDWQPYRIRPAHKQQDINIEDEVHDVHAAVRSESVTWLVYRSQGQRRAWNYGGLSTVLGRAVGAFYGALPASGGTSPGSVIYIFQEENGVNVYRRVGDKTGVQTTETTLTDLGPMARHSGITASTTRLFVYATRQSPSTTYGFRYREEATRLSGSVKFVDLPRVTTPRDIPLRIPDGWHVSRAGALDKVFKANEGIPPSVLTPLNEAYYHVPLYLALKLQGGGHWDAALALFRTFYDYTGEAGQRTVYPELDASAALPAAAVQQAAADWLRDPLNPHRLAATRRGAYLRFTVVAVARCLADYADAEFTLDTPESRSKARLLYTAALDCLNIPELGSGPKACDDPLADIVVEPGAEIPPAVAAGIGEITDQLTNAGIFDGLGGKTAYELFTSLFSSKESWQQKLLNAQTFAAEQLRKSPAPLTLSQITLEKPAFTAEAHAELVTDLKLDLAAQSIGELLGEPSALPETATPLGAAGGLVLLVGPLLAPPQYHFCLPPSVTLAALRLHLDLSLWKLRSCRNIAGVRREQDLYSAPIDTTSGRPTIGSGGVLNIPAAAATRPTPYRYPVLVERARHLAQLAGQLEARLLSALEQRDREAYDMLRANQDLTVARSNVQLQALRLTEAQSGVGLAELQRDRARLQQQHYTALLAEPVSRTEQAAVNYLINAARYASISQDLYIWSAAIQGVSVGVPILASAGAGLAAGGPSGALLSAATTALAQSGEIAQLLGTVANAYSSRANQYSTLSSVQSTLAGYERRAQEWQLQQRLAGLDVQIGDRQIAAANDTVRVVEQEGATAGLEADNARVTAEFLSKKFTDVELYDWMSSVLEGIYRTMLQQATAVANLAVQQLTFERQEPPPTLIKADYWTSGASGTGVDRKGLTGSARLLQDIEALDQHAFLTRQRKLQLSTTISLARLAPAEFQRFRETGVMDFATPMELFDRDFPGHYLRLIQRVKVSVIALIPPTQGIHATLASTGISRVVTGPDLFQTVTIRREPEEVALTSPTEATGLFELESQHQNELLLPFEGNGVDTAFQFRMPKAANPWDYSTLADVLITYEYSADDSFDYRQQVIRALPPFLQAERGFSLRNDFPDAWYDLHNPELQAEEQRMLVRVRTVREDFPSNLDQLRIDHLLLHLGRVDPTVGEVRDLRLTFQEAGAGAPIGGAASTIDGIVSTRQGNAGAWQPIIGRRPFGVWELQLPYNEQTVDLFKNERIEDGLLVISYSGLLPDWPAG